MEELTEDVLEIITVFSARLYGARSKQNKKIIKTPPFVQDDTGKLMLREPERGDDAIHRLVDVEARRQTATMPFARLSSLQSAASQVSAGPSGTTRS